MLHDRIIIFLLVNFAAAAADPYHISINCGGDAHGGRYWLREGSSTVTTTKGGLIRARISGSRFSYSLKLNPGQKIVRLHFHPSSYNGFESSNDFFSVEAGNSSLLANFSASVAARALSVNVVVKQFCVTVEENDILNLAFSPEWGNSYAFVNEIEIISIPYCDGGVAPNSIIHVDNSTALERVHYQHVKWGPVSSGDDIASMFGMWSKQQRVGEDAEMGTNKTWRVSVDAGFNYLVRLHLCEAGLHMDFVLLINGRVALTCADMLQQRRGNRDLLWYNNYMVMDEELKQGDLSISLHSSHEFLDRHGPIEGYEVFKMSSHQSASLLIQTQLHSLLYSILFQICCIVFLVYLQRKISQCKFTKEDNKPLAREKQLSHRFSLARILGICGYGGDGEGFVDYGREIVVIKPLKMDSNQRENKFRNVIEALWGLRHVSFIGHCREQLGVADHLYRLARKSNNFFPQSWKQRLQICVEVSQALEYLHTGPTVHRDLKPANILLDDKFVARLADFGVSKTGSVSESQSQYSTKLIGTLGYIAPDYITRGEQTKQSGIYSFGALVLEVLCGRAGREPRTKVEDVDYDKIDFGNHEEVELEVLTDSSTDSQQQQLPPGFEYYPTDAELVVYAIKRATSNFRSDLVLGEGGFGSVYKRFMNSESDQHFREWQSEVNFVRRVMKLLGHCHENNQLFFGMLSHPNLLKLLGYGWDDNELLLVYDYMKKGSLQNHLFESYGQPLPWDIRVKILIGASRGLEYLHSSDKKVIYRDFKSSKILLDKLHHAKISDFGLATTCPFADKTPVSARIMGTSGYTAPEYIMTGHVLVKSNVNGFGIVLLENSCDDEEQNLVVWMKPRLSDQRKMINPNSRSTMIGKTRGMHAVEVPVIYRDFRASNILLDVFKLGVLMDSSTGSHQWQIDRCSTDTAVNVQSAITAAPTPAKKQVQHFQSRRVTCYADTNFQNEKVRNLWVDSVRGGFGRVYKGWIHEKSSAKEGSGFLVAIKKISHLSTQGFREWQSVVQFLGRLSHPNLVKLIGCFWEDNKQLLVYEFMKKGSFENHPFKSYGQPLPWSTRVKILIGASRGLEYLHSSDKKVFNRDFKSSKILLDKLHHAKISDFGLATTCPFADKTPVSAQIMGTFGYMAPEYIMTGHVNVKADVYSFGVVLVEVLTGLQAIDQRRGGEQQNLVVWMKPRLYDQKKLIHTNSRFLMMSGTTRGMYTVEVPVIYRDFKASNILLDEVKLGGVLMDFLTGSHQWQIDRRSTDTAVNEQPPITPAPSPVRKQVQQVQQTEHNKAHVPAQAPAHSDWSKHKMDVEYPPTTLPLQKQACNPQTGVEIINSILLSIL